MKSFSELGIGIAVAAFPTILFADGTPRLAIMAIYWTILISAVLYEYANDLDDRRM